MKLKASFLARSDEVYNDDDVPIGSIYYATAEDMKAFRVAFYEIVIDAEKWQHHQMKSRERMLRYRSRGK